MKAFIRLLCSTLLVAGGLAGCLCAIWCLGVAAYFIGIFSSFTDPTLSEYLVLGMLVLASLGVGTLFALLVASVYKELR
jgi:hypothetical protein